VGRVPVACGGLDQCLSPHRRAFASAPDLANSLRDLPAGAYEELKSSHGNPSVETSKRLHVSDAAAYSLGKRMWIKERASDAMRAESSEP